MDKLWKPSRHGSARTRSQQGGSTAQTGIESAVDPLSPDNLLIQVVSCKDCTYIRLVTNTVERGGSRG